MSRRVKNSLLPLSTVENHSQQLNLYMYKKHETVHCIDKEVQRSIIWRTRKEATVEPMDYTAVG